MLTMQRVEIGSKEGKAFLRKVARHNQNARMGEDWSIRAGDHNEWIVTFFRTIKGDIGESEECVEVATDVKVHCHGKTGRVKSFSDSGEVYVIRPSGFHLSSSTCGLVARLLGEGWRLSVEIGSGSTNSSHHGLAFYNLELSHPEFPYASIAVGGQSVSVNGESVISGSVHIR